MANWELLHKVADHINPENFNMGIYAMETECRTVACVAGHTVWITHPDEFHEIAQHDWLEFSSRKFSSGNVRGGEIDYMAQKELGLTIEEANELFYVLSRDVLAFSKNSALVPEALRWMADNRTISWRAAAKAVGFEENKKTS